MGTDRTNRFLRWCAALTLCLLGCSCPKAVHTYEYLTDYDLMVDRYEPLLSLVYLPEPVAFRAYRAILIRPFAVGERWVEDVETAESYARLFRIELHRELKKLDRFDLVSIDPEEWAAGPAPTDLLVLEGKITKFHVGSGLLRYMSGFNFLFQFAATDFQVEGRLTEADTGRLVMEFVDRRRNLGNTPFGPNPRNLQDDFAMNVTCVETARCLARFIDMGYEGLPAAVALPEAGRAELAEERR